MTQSHPRFENLIEEYHDELFRYIWRMLANSGRTDVAEEANDLTQDVFMRAYRAYPRLRAESNIRAWLYKIATNCVYSASTRDRRKWSQDVALFDEHDIIPDEGTPQPELQFLDGETLDAVREAIDALPGKQRAGLLMRYVQELEYAEIAEALDCSEDSARANVYQAIKRLRAALADQDAREI